MWRSLFLSTSSLVLLGGASCGDDECGPMGSPEDGLTASSVEVTLSYANLISRAGSDCPDPDAPAGVIAVTIEGQQTDGIGFITLCIPRPDLLELGNRSLGHTISTADIRIVDVVGTSNNCSYTIDKTRPPTGKGAGLGVCANGTDQAGFAIDLDGAISLRRTCGATVDTIGVKLIGKIAVDAE